ncbi:hypothetical protein WME73_04005 [Sorangium sp. So ce302]|uniref:hypothetical protein n=1 Tax=Sorangium sp. So ce302 TaxID=3133297 RepID=UPI003F641E06
MTEKLVHADFPRNVREQLAHRLKLSGMSVDAALDPWDVAVRYFDYKRRYIPARPRKVARSREFNKLLLSSDHQAGVTAIIEDAVAGRTLLPYFSRTWMNLELHDILFNDWRVCHMHLGGRTIEIDGFVKRTGPVLFVFVTSDTIYLIDVMEHGSGHPTTFAKGRILQILHDNWPKLIEHGKLPGVSDLSVNDDESRRVLSRRRNKSHFALGAEVDDGTVYGIVGDGYMSSGRNMLAVNMANLFFNRLYRLQENLRTQGPQIRADINQRLGWSLSELRLHMDLKHIVRGIEYSVQETQSKEIVHKEGRIFFPP